MWQLILMFAKSTSDIEKNGNRDHMNSRGQIEGTGMHIINFYTPWVYADKQVG